jgi:hypothetical protein
MDGVTALLLFTARDGHQQEAGPESFPSGYPTLAVPHCLRPHIARSPGIIRKQDLRVLPSVQRPRPHIARSPIIIISRKQDLRAFPSAPHCSQLHIARNSPRRDIAAHSRRSPSRDHHMSRGPQLPVAPFVDFFLKDCHCKIWRWLAAIGRLSVFLEGP